MQVGNRVGDLSDLVDDLELDQAVAGGGTDMSLLEGHGRERREGGEADEGGRVGGRPSRTPHRRYSLRALAWRQRHREEIEIAA